MTSKPLSQQLDFGQECVIADEFEAGTSIKVAGNTLSGAELGFVDGVTAGTALASKAIVLGASKDIATITSATITTLTSTAVNSATLAATTSATVTSASAVALTVGLAGATNPAFTVDSSTGSQAAGLKITGAATGGTVAVVATDSGSNTNVTLNAKGSGTIGIGSVSTGAVTITPATTVTGALTLTAGATVGTTLAVTGATTPTGGVAPAGGFALSPRLMHTGTTAAQVSTDFTDQTPVNTEVYFAEVYIPANVTVTGVSLFRGSVSSGNYKVGLANSSGAVVATSASTASSGTDAYVDVPFTGTYAAVGPATYYVLAFYDNNTVRANTHTIGRFVAAKQTGQTYATGFTTITPGSSFTTALGPVATLY